MRKTILSFVGCTVFVFLGAVVGSCEEGIVERDCVPDCGVRVCGGVPNGCGDSCGSCADPESCDIPSGHCKDCAPDCSGRECGPDPQNCGTSCGTCKLPDQHCNPTTGRCEGCSPDCGVRVCGPVPNGCGESCGSCQDPESCDVSTGQCNCTPDCGVRVCGGVPNGCGESCGNCENPQTCDLANGQCVGPENTCTHFVDGNSGDDARSGDSEAQAWKTIQHAAEVAVAGNTVCVKSGTYNEQVTVKNSGNDGNPITFMSATERAAIIDGTGLPINVDGNGCGDGLFQVFGKSYIKIIGFAIKNSLSVGIFVRESEAYPTNIVVQKNYVYNTRSSGVIIRTGSGHIVDGNEIELAANSSPPFRAQEIISLQGLEKKGGSGVSNFEIKNNVVHDGGNPADGGEGIDAKVGASFGKIHHNIVYNVVSTGIYVDGWNQVAHDIEIFDNVVHDINRRWGHGISIGAETGGSADTIGVYNNIVYDCDYNGINTPTNDNLNAVVKNLRIVNNTAFNNGLSEPTGMGGISVQVWFNNPTIQNVEIVNNIVSSNKGFGIAVGTSNVSGVTIANNLVFPGSDFSKENDGVNVVYQDPQFINAAAHDFRLQSTSPAVGGGDCAAAPGLDFDGNPRPRGEGCDIGAYEQ